MFFSFPRTLSASVAFAALAVGGCGQQNGERSSSASQPSRDLINDSANGVRSVAGSLSDRRANFLNRIRAADPQKATIERAVINEQNELGLILSRNTNLDDVPKLLKSMIVQMDQFFPGENHVAIAYAPTTPPRTIGTARSDARTRDITYQRASTP